MSWSTVALGDAVTFRGGGTPSRDEPKFWGGAIPWATVKDLNSGYVLRTTQEFITEEGLRRSASNLVPAGTVVIPTRMALGKAVLTEIDIAINQDLKAAFPVKELDARFLLWFFIANSQRIEAMGKGATVKGVTLDQLRSLRIPLPPLAEQRRIAAILDKADALRAKRREAIAKLDQLVRAVFVDMFGDPQKNPKRWPVVELGQLANFINGDRGKNYPARTDFIESGIPFVNAGHLQSGNVDFAEMNFIAREKFNMLGSGKVQSGDILYCLRGSLGKAAIYWSECDAAVASSLVIIRTNGRCINRYVFEYLVSPWGQKQIDLYDSGSSQPNLSAANVKKFSIPLPPLAEQKRFSEIASRIETEKGVVQRAAAKLDVLFASLKQQSFVGVP